MTIEIRYTCYNEYQSSTYKFDEYEFKEFLVFITLTLIGYKAEQSIFKSAYYTFKFGTEIEYNRIKEWADKKGTKQ